MTFEFIYILYTRKKNLVSHLAVYSFTGHKFVGRLRLVNWKNNKNWVSRLVRTSKTEEKKGLGALTF